MRTKIGTWHQTEQGYTEHTGYAADHVEHRLKAGDYDAVVEWNGGYTIPMPEWLLVGVDSEVVSGGYYSGFGGVNYSFSPEKLGPSHITHQLYSYHIPDLVRSGKLTLDPEWEWMNEPDYKKFLASIPLRTSWQDLKLHAVA